MTQNSNQSSASIQTSASGNNVGNPLDQLEELIKKSQLKSSSQASDQSVEVQLPNSADANSQAKDDFEADVQQKMKDIAKLKQQKETEEKMLIKKQQELMKQAIATSPQTQKRAEAAAEEAEQQKSQDETHQIKQLSRIKIKQPIED